MATEAYGGNVANTPVMCSYWILVDIFPMPFHGELFG